MKRILTVALFALAVPSFARVLSHAPYTTQTTVPGYHERASRYFVLIERVTTGGSLSQVVLYDSTAAEEPRVVYPASGAAPITFAAVYEPKIQPGAGPVPPWILVGDAARPFLSVDGGASWKLVEGLREPPLVAKPRDTDIGGPFVQGLAAQVTTGNDAFPFVIVHEYSFAAIRPNATAFSLFGWTGLQIGFETQQPTFLLGRNRAGDQFLVLVDRTTIIIDLTKFEFRAVVHPLGATSGWITPDGSVYFQVVRPEGRFLYLNHKGSLGLVLGPEGVTPPKITDPPRHLDPMAFFAVPAHDFNGAWIIRRGEGKPTKLLRHTPDGGLQEMWSDAGGPQVEALIADASGESLLIQIHRRRDVALPEPFLVPAFAVWRIGDPAPRTYDDLDLNESVNKGFIHVNVGQLKSGEPFVFTTGMPDVVPIPGTGIIDEPRVVRGSLRQRLVFPGAARLPGANNSYWLTDVTISNPFDYEQDVEVRFVGLGEDVTASGAQSKTLTLQAKEIRLIPDVLKDLFGIESGGGALHFLPESDVNVTGRTYTRRPEGGTLGFGMQAIDFFNVAGPRFPMTFAGAFPGENFRTNLLLTDTSGRGSTATLSAYGLAGPMGASSYELAAPVNGVTQFNGLGTPLGLMPNDEGGLAVRPTRGTVIPTVVAIDNRTNDPTYFPPDIAADIPRMIPVIGHVDGAFGSRFRSDLYLLNPAPFSQAVFLEAKEWNSPLRNIVSITMAPHEARVIPDVLSTLFGMSGLARLHYETVTSRDGVRATSRTYTVDKNGATYGCLIPPLNNFQIAAPGDRLEILGVNAGDGFRASLGLVELARFSAPGETTVRVSILDENSRVLDTFTVAVPIAGGLQLNNLFAARGLTPPSAAMIVVENIGTGLIGAYATLTDNTTNDATYLGAQIGAQSN